MTRGHRTIAVDVSSAEAFAQLPQPIAVLDPFRMRSFWLPFLVGLLAVGAGGCPDVDAPKDAGTASSTTKVVDDSARFQPVNVDDPVGELSRLLGQRRGYCVQFRAVPEKADAVALAERIQKEAKISVGLIEAEIKGRGTWYRLCAGAEPTVAAATAKAEGWTATGGALSPYMEPVAPGQAKYFVKEREVRSHRLPTEPQARLILAARPDGKRPVKMAAMGADGAIAQSLAAVTTPKDAKGRVDVFVVDPQGRSVEIVGEGTPGCAPCGAALASAPVVARRLLGVGNVIAGDAEEIFIEESTAKKSRILVVLRQQRSPDGRVTLVRQAAYWLGTELAGLRLLTEVDTVEADGDVEKELALILTELPVFQNRLCAVRRRAEIHDLTPTTPQPLDENYARAIAVTEDAAKAGQAATLLVRALDRLDDFRSASRICAAYLSRGQDVGLTQHCLGRISALVRQGRKIEAVNAAGLLAESASSLRGAIAGPFYEGVTALDKDVRLTVADDNCASAPLVDAVDKRPLAQTLRIAKAANKERVNLAELVDAVFVTGARDFGPKTPVGKVTAKWVERLRIALPARFAAIEALLAVPPEGAQLRGNAVPPPPPPPKRGPASLQDDRAVDETLGRPRIILKVHDDEAGAP